MKVAVHKNIFDWAIERSGKNIEELLYKFPKLNDWQNQSDQPTLNQLEKFAKTTYTPIGKFFLDSPPEDILPIADFRTLPNSHYTKPSPHLLDTIYICQQRQEWYRQHCLAQRDKPLDFVGSANINDSPKKIAQQIRSTFSLSLAKKSLYQAFSQRRDCVEEQGVLVMCAGTVGSNTHRSLNLEEFRGFALSDDYAPIIFINAKDSNAGRSFTLIHELAHIYLGESGVSMLNPKDKHKVEQWCNKVAAEVLVPLDDFKEQFNKHSNNDAKVSALGKIYMVSTLVILNKMKDAKFIDKTKFWKLYREEEEKIKAELAKQKKGGGGNYYNTKPATISKCFGKALTQSTLEGNTLYRDAMQMLGIKSMKTFNTLANQFNPWINYLD